MNFFDRELRKLADAGIDLDNVKFVGRACYGDLGAQNRAKLQFITTGYADHYSALAVDILNRTDGKVDSLLFRFEDIWGRKLVGNKDFPEGVTPHIWTSGLKGEWSVYKPTPADFERLANAVNDYLSVFSERDADRDREKTAFDNALNRGKAKIAEYKAKNTTTTKSKNKQEEI